MDQQVNPKRRYKERDYLMIKPLIEARLKLKITQKELSTITGINQANISKIEQGDTNPTLSTLNRLAEGLGLRMKIEFLPIEKEEVEEVIEDNKSEHE